MAAAGVRQLPLCRGDGSRSARRPPGNPGLAQGTERGLDLGREHLGLFPGGEVTAPVDLVEVAEGRVGRLDPAARGRPDLTGERGEADRDAGACPVSQYSRGAEAPVPVSQYSVMLSRIRSRVRWPAGCLSRKAREILP